MNPFAARRKSAFHLQRQRVPLISGPAAGFGREERTTAAATENDRLSNNPVYKVIKKS